MLIAENSESPSRAVSVRDEEGNLTEIMHVNCNIRPGRGLYLSIDVFDEGQVAANKEDVQAQLDEFAAGVFARAAATGVPAPTLGGGGGA